MTEIRTSTAGTSCSTAARSRALSEPVRWSPGEAALSSNTFFPRLFLHRRSGIEDWDLSAPTRPALTVTDYAVMGTVSPSSMHNLVAFSTGSGVQVRAPGGSGWTHFEGFDTAAPVSKLRLTSDESSLSVLYQMGTEVWLASRRGTVPWRHQRILDAGAPLVEIADFEAKETSARVAFRTATAAWGGAEDRRRALRDLLARLRRAHPGRARLQSILGGRGHRRT